MGEARIYMKLHQAAGKIVLAACDKELLGRVLQNGPLSYPVSEGFYGGDLVTEETFLKMVVEVSSSNVIGEYCVGLLIQSGLIESESVRSIGGIRHTQVYNINMDG